jgi:hypothetical protein
VEIIQFDLKDRRKVHQFLDLPFRLYAEVPQWVPPLAPEARRMLDRRHPFFAHSEAAFFLAIQAGRSGPQVIGRLAVLNNHNYNAFNHENTAFFYLFECEENLNAAKGLFSAAASWARAHGLNCLVGPKGFTVFDGIGLLVKGFEHRPAFGLPYNLPYYPRLIEACGFRPRDEIVSGYLNADAEFPQKLHEISKTIQERRGLRIARYKSRKDLRLLVPKLRELYNGALEGTTGNVPLTEAEAKTLADQLFWFADPRLIKIVMKGDEPVGFLFAYPDISAAAQRTEGRIFPFGWIYLLRELRRTKWVNINGAGMLEGYRGLGGTALLFSEMHKSIMEGGFKHADLVQIGTENDRMLRELRTFGVEFYKVHRIYEQDII